jgi:hypothetical protein
MWVEWIVGRVKFGCSGVWVECSVGGVECGGSVGRMIFSPESGVWVIRCRIGEPTIGLLGPLLGINISNIYISFRNIYRGYNLNIHDVLTLV